MKENAQLEMQGKYTRLNTEGYGGMLCAAWLDRPLSLAGRVIVKEGNSFVTRLVKIDRDLVLIPNVAIHLNRDVIKVMLIINRWICCRYLAAVKPARMIISTALPRN